MALLTYQRKMMYQLLFWAGLSTGVGLAMLTSTRLWVRSFGGMTLAWAVVNAGIAFFALRGIRKKSQQSPDEATVQKWARQLLTLLWVNALLDGVYILVGLGLALWDPANRMLVGFGWAIIVQGGFLLLFDGWHAIQIRRRVW